MKKRPGGNRVFIGWKQFCVRHFLCWSKRWLILKVFYHYCCVEYFFCFFSERGIMIQVEFEKRCGMSNSSHFLLCKIWNIAFWTCPWYLSFVAICCRILLFVIWTQTMNKFDSSYSSIVILEFQLEWMKLKECLVASFYLINNS